jgi:hypothetical protein
LILAVTGAAMAQETRATVSGRVIDSTGGVIPGVSVSITNVETNATNNAITNDSGLYEVPYLMPGQYQVTAELTGFKKSVRKGVALSVGSRVSIDLVLEVGEVSESVTVTAQEPLLDTTSASIADVIDNKRVMELPVLGNSAMLMAGLATGMQRTGGYNYLGLHSTIGASDYRTAGGVGGNEWSLDGTPNSGHTRRAAYLPYTDAIDEFRVEGTSYDARVGHTTGAYIAMQSKAGTNRYHGTATWNHWQQRWNATPNNDNGVYWGRIKAAEAAGNTELAKRLRAEERQPSGRSNNYAASLGGPVWIPKLFDGKDKLFFFFIFNGFKDNKTEEPGNKLFSVPTADERKGDFSRLLAVNRARYQIYDPLTTKFDSKTGLFVRDPFPNNVIPANRILNPMYKFYEKLYPLPNNPPQMDAEGRNNYFNGAIPFNWDYKALQNRVDYVMNEKNRIFFRWSYNKFVEDRNDWTFETARFLHSNALNRINKGAGFDYVRTLNSTTILNAAIAYNRYFDNGLNIEQQKFKASDVGLPKYIDEKAGDLHTLPTVDFSDYRDVSGGVSRLQPISTGTLKTDVTRYLGKHSLVFGWDGRMYYRVGGSPGNTSGRFEFRNGLLRANSAATGVGNLGIEWAAFMLGIPSSLSIDTNDSYYITTPYHGVFVQDSYRLSRKLTINLGLRMEYEGSIRERYNRGLRDYDFNYIPPIAAAAQAAYAAAPLPERAASDFIIRGGSNYLGLNVPRTRTDPTYRYMPRFGFAYSWMKNTVIRGGYGTYYDTLNVSHTTIDQSGYSRGTGTTITNDQGVTWNFGYFSNNNSPLSDPFPVRSDGTRFNTPLGNSLGRNSFLGRSFSFLNPTFEPLLQHRWSIEVERQLWKNAVFAIGYSGSWVGNLNIDRNLRPVPEKYWASGLVRNDAISNDLNRNLTNPFYIGNFSDLQKQDPALYQQLSTLGFFTSRTISKAQLLRPFPHMTGLTLNEEPAGKNSYHSLQARFDKRFSQGWTLNTHYEYAHTMSKDWFPNEFDAEPDWRESDNSRPHRWVATSIWELPFGRGRWLLNDSGWLNSILGGWQIGTIWQMQSGECIDFGNVFYYGSNLRDIVLPKDQRSKDRWFNTDLFEKNSTKTAASFHRRVFPNRMNWLRTATLYQLDANLQKAVAVREGMKALFRIDLLNAPNHQVLGGPEASPTNATFGRINGYVNTPRYIQFQVRLTY